MADDLSYATGADQRQRLSFFGLGSADREARLRSLQLDSTRAADYVSKPAFGREGHGLLYGDEASMGGAVQPYADVKVFANSLAEGEHGGETTTMRIAPPPAMPLAAVEGLEGLKRLAEQQAAQALVGMTNLLERGNLSKPAGELDNTVEMHLGPNVLQRYYELPTLMGRKVVTSAWVVRGVPTRRPNVCLHLIRPSDACPLPHGPAGMPVAACFREDTDRTTNNNSCFVPHYVEPSSLPNAELHRDLPMSDNQRRLRSELYGTGGVASADYGNAVGGVVEPDQGQDQFHARCCKPIYARTAETRSACKLLVTRSGSVISGQMAPADMRAVAARPPAAATVPSTTILLGHTRPQRPRRRAATPRQWRTPRKPRGSAWLAAWRPSARARRALEP